MWWWDCDVICSIIFFSILLSACICLGFGWNNHSFSFVAYRILCTEVWQGTWAVNFVTIHCSYLAWLCTCFSPLCSLWVKLEVKCTVNPIFRGLIWRSLGEEWDTAPKCNTWGRAEAVLQKRGEFIEEQGWGSWHVLEETLQGDNRWSA